MLSHAYEEGDPTSDICIVTHMPTKLDMKLSQPLTGPLGDIFNKCLHSAKIIRRQVYILDIFERPYTLSRDQKKISDEYGELLWTLKGGLTELGEEASTGFRERLAKSSANVIIPLGSIALSVIFGDERIMKWRGSILTSLEKYGKKKLVPTVHPESAMQGKYLWRHLIMSDLQKAEEQCGFPDLRLTPRTLRIDPTFFDVMAYMDEVEKLDQTASDIEVLNHQVSCFCLTLSSQDSMCIPLVAENGAHRWSLEQECTIMERYARILGNREMLKINQNIIFDISVLYQQNNIFTDLKNLGDPMIAHHIMFPDFNKGLDFLCSMWTDIPYYKDDGKLWQKPWNDLETFWRYNARDGVAAQAIWEEMEPLLDKDGYRQTYDETISLFPSLLYMMMRGMKVDRDALQITKDRVSKEIAERQTELAQVAEWDFNPASPKQCQEYFYVTKGIKPYVSRSTGRPTTDDQAMSRIFRAHRLREAKLVQEIRQLSKLKGTYLEVGIDMDDRVRCSYNPRGTTTGRLSSSQTIFSTGLNMQNLHPDFKEFLVADEEITQ